MANVVEQHVRHVVGDHRAEVERVIAVPLAVARRRGDIVLVARPLVPCHDDVAMDLHRHICSSSIIICPSLPFSQLSVRIPQKKMWRIGVAPDLREGDVVQEVDVPLAHAVMRKENVRLLNEHCRKRVPETTEQKIPSTAGKQTNGDIRERTTTWRPAPSAWRALPPGPSCTRGSPSGRTTRTRRRCRTRRRSAASPSRRFPAERG